MTNQEKMDLLIKASKMSPMEVFENRKEMRWDGVLHRAVGCFPGEIVRVMVIKDAVCSYLYARDVLKSRFEQGEAAISQSTEYSYNYARDVIEGRWEQGEAAIMQSAEYSYNYAWEVVEGRFEPGEAAIMQDAEWFYQYALDVLKGDLTPEMIEAWESLNAQPA